VTPSRPLFDLDAGTLGERHVYIASAVIATYGEQCGRSFYVLGHVGLKFHSLQSRSTGAQAARSDRARRQNGPFPDLLQQLVLRPFQDQAACLIKLFGNTLATGSCDVKPISA